MNDKKTQILRVGIEKFMKFFFLFLLYDRHRLFCLVD
jgi:hypothetical protein